RKEAGADGSLSDVRHRCAGRFDRDGHGAEGAVRPRDERLPADAVLYQDDGAYDRPQNRQGTAEYRQSEQAQGTYGTVDRIPTDGIDHRIRPPDGGDFEHHTYRRGDRHRETDARRDGA